MKEKRSTRRKKKKTKLIVFCLFILILLCALGVFITYSYLVKDNNIVTNEKVAISKNYMIVKKSTKLLDKKGNKVGSVDKGIIIGGNNSNRLFKISNTDYYINSNDLESTKYKVNNNNYVDIGKKITTNDKYNLLFEDKIISVNNSDEINIKYMDTDYYYVDYSGIYYKIKKDEVKDIKDYEVKTKISNNISVINFSRIENECNYDECYTKDNIEKVLDYIKKSDYYTININDFKNWNLGNLKLKENALLLITPSTNEVIEELNKKYDNMINIYTPESEFTYLYNNKPNKVSTNFSALNNYSVYKNTSLDDIKRMIKGEEFNLKFFEGNTATSVPVLNYHFFYDRSKNQNNCNEEICLDVVKFRQHLDYLRDNGYTTLTMNQFVKWIYGEIEIPEKSVLLTIDDGAAGTGFHNGNDLIPILDEYKMHATLFLISGWWGINNYKSSYLEIQSHTHDMHNRGTCGNVQLICNSYDQIKQDLSLSIATIGDNNSFCYPFYKYDDEAISVIKELGFKVAFAGGSVNATRKSNKYTIPRYPIYDSITLDKFIKMVG